MTHEFKPFVLAILGSPRKGANSEILADRALEGAKEAGAETEKIYVKDLNIKPCRGCLRCNLTGYCSIKNDDFKDFMEKFFQSRAIIMAAPVYYHYIPGQMKLLMDRFRSSVHVKMTPQGLVHTLRYKNEEQKKFFFILTLGNSIMEDALPALEGLEFWAKMTCKKPVIIPPLVATFLALPKQVRASRERLSEIFKKMEIPTELVEEKYALYEKFLEDSYRGGKNLGNSLSG